MGQFNCYRLPKNTFYRIDIEAKSNTSVEFLLFYLKISGNPFVFVRISYAISKSELPLSLGNVGAARFPPYLLGF